MSAYFIVRVRVRDESTYAAYRQMVVPTLEAYQGHFLVRGGRAEMLEGAGTPGRVIVLEFPSYEQARAWYDSDEYAPAKQLRHACSDAEAILVEGV